MNEEQPDRPKKSALAAMREAPDSAERRDDMGFTPVSQTIGCTGALRAKVRQASSTTAGKRRQST
jgi:hypothetical protein